LVFDVEIINERADKMNILFIPKNMGFKLNTKGKTKVLKGQACDKLWNSATKE